MSTNPNREKQHSRKKAPRKKKLSKVKIPEGLFSKSLRQKLKKAPLGTSDNSLIMEVLNSLPASKLKTALNKGTTKERSLLFSILPSDQIKSILGSLPASVLAPAHQPPSPLPSPTNGPPASILTTTYENVPYPPARNDPNWAKKITGGKTIRDFPDTVFEWTSVYDKHLEKEGSLNNPMVGLTGWAVHPEKSSNDVWFVHPFGFDYEYYIVPDPQYEDLLAASNIAATDSSYAAATKRAQDIGLKAPKGVIGVEIGQRLVPEPFQNLIKDGSRVATFGRWIVDSGHDDFHTEIHSPLLMAVATPASPPTGRLGASQMTQLQIVSRPYTVSERFGEGNFIDHLLTEVAKVETTILGIPFSWRVEAHPTVLTTPYEGRPYIKLLIQPPPQKRRPEGGLAQRLMVSYHFTHRAGVAIQAFDAGNGTVGIIIVFGDLNPAKLPPKHDLTVTWNQVKKFSKFAWIIDALEIADILTLNILPAIILNRGILTDIYDPPKASSPLDNQNVASAINVNQIRPWAGIAEDDEQPFPVYGWLNVWWEDIQITNQATSQ